MRHFYLSLSFVLSFACSSWAFAQADLSKIYQRLSDVQSDLSKNRDFYSQSDVERIETSLDEVIALTRNPGGSSGSERLACVNRAHSGPFTQDQAARLCSPNGNTVTADCALKAFSGPFTSENAIELCRGKRSLLPVDCALKAFSGPFTTVQSIALCKTRPHTETADCALRAHAGPFTTDQSLRLCVNGGSLANAQCALDAYQTLNSEQAVELCKVASARVAKKTP